MANNALIEAMVKVQAELPAVPKDANGHGYRYQTLDSILNAIRPLLCQHSLVLTQWPAVPSQPGYIAVETRVSHVSGNSMAVIGELPILEDNKRMNSSQAAGAAYSYLRRYGVAAVFGIVSDADTDAAPEPVKRSASGHGRAATAIKPDNVTDEEAAAILQTPAADFLATVAALHDGYNDTNLVGQALRKIGYSSIPGDPEARLIAYSQLKARKEEAAAVMDQVNAELFS